MTKRFYTGARTGGPGGGEAARLKRIEIEKGGKLPLSSTDRYKRIMKKKLEASQAEIGASRSNMFQMPGAKPVERKMSKTTANAMRMIAQRKAMKEEKELRAMVVVQPRTLKSGRIDAKGNVYDLGNNLTLKVNLKTGQIKTHSGWSVGKYNNRNKFSTNGILEDSLKKHGAYFLQQKKLMLLQEQERLAALSAGGATVWGAAGGGGGLASEQFMEQHYNGGGAYGGGQSTAHNRGSGVNGWGAMSNSVLGTHAENVHGGMVDNVWGGTDSNIWGGLGGTAWGDGGGVWGSGRNAWSSMKGGGLFGSANWGKRGLRIFGSGGPNQKNYLRKLGALFAGVPLIGRLVGRSGRAAMRSR